jgi:GT2 family glycosyltransferase
MTKAADTGEPRLDSELAAPRLGIVLVNWRRPDDSIECLESVLRGTIPVRVVVVDNGSGDGSLDRIASWAAGAVDAVAASPAMAGHIAPPIAKPVAVQRLTGAEAATTPPTGTLSLIDAGRNGGFAAGNNIGLAHLLQGPGIDYFWLLNNDTIIEPDAAAALVAHLDASGAGMCGTVVRYYWRPDRVQALGGHRFNKWTGTSIGIGSNQPAGQAVDSAQVAAQTDFVLGASLAVSRDFLTGIGPMAESYFLYFEEADWAARNAALGGGRYPLGFADKAVVFHKEGGAIGSSSAPGQQSQLSDYWLNRSRLAYTRRFNPHLLPLHWLLTIGIAGRRLLRRQPAKSVAVMRALFGLGY